MVVAKVLLLMTGSNFLSRVGADLQKAFDTVPHVLLLFKFFNIGLDSFLVTWVYNYLAERKQVVMSSSQAADVLLSGLYPWSPFISHLNG